jgi:uracil-DNA glycosylase family 4
VVNAHQVAYLRALGVDVYVPRSAPALLAMEPAATAAPPQPGAIAAAQASRPVAPAAQQPQAEPQQPAQPDVARDLDWDSLRAAVAACQRCELHGTRTQTVFGVGNTNARWMFIGEAPGADEDRQGEPFVGRAGQLLTSMIRALGLQREDVFIANVLKCRPPGNRDPRPVEAASCRTYLERQVALVNPTLVVAVGRIAAQNLLATETPIAKLRGKVHAFGARSWPLVVTYHPAYLLRTPSEKRKTWHDLLHARQLFERLQRESAAGGPA